MEDGQTRSPGRQRGAGFPVLSLPKAADALRSAARYGVHQSRAAFAERLGHKTADSGPYRQKLAALREYGLISPSGGDVSLTELGQRVAVPVDDERERAALAEAFFHCELFSDLFESTAKGVDLDLAAIAATAFHTFHVSVGARDACAASFSESAIHAGLGRRTPTGAFQLVDPTGQVATSVGVAKSGDPALASSPRSGRPYGTDIAINHAVGEGSIEFSVRLMSPLPSAAFEVLHRAAAVIEELAQTLGKSQIDHENQEQ